MDNAAWEKASNDEKLNWLHEKVLTILGHLDGPMRQRLKVIEDGIGDVAGRLHALEEVGKVPL